MSSKNGSKQFLFVVCHKKDHGDQELFLVRGDRDPTREELVALLGIDFDEMHEFIHVQRYSLDDLPTLPSKP